MTFTSSFLPAVYSSDGLTLTLTSGYLPAGYSPNDPLPGNGQVPVVRAVQVDVVLPVGLGSHVPHQIHEQHSADDEGEAPDKILRVIEGKGSLCWKVIGRDRATSVEVTVGKI